MKKLNNINGLALDKLELREQILNSMIASFKIEGINITEQSAKEIFEKLKYKLR